MTDNILSAQRLYSRTHQVALSVVIADELVTEYEAEEDLSEFTAWYKKGKRVPPGTPIGYSFIVCGEESYIIPYDGMIEVDEEPEG